MSLRIFSTLCLLAVSAATLAAQEREKGKSNLIDPRGEPKESRLARGYNVWFGPGAWHVRAFSNKKEHRFHGVIKVERGTIESVAGVGLEGKGKDKWKLNADRTQLTFDLRTTGMEGFNFRCSHDAQKVRFDLEIDGKHDPELVAIGQRGAHPQRDPFVFFAHHVPGHPLGFGPGEPVSYGVWNAGAVWHLRTATDKKNHRFHGKIEVDGGTIEGIDAFRLEDKGRVKDTWRLSADRREVVFDFRTEGEIDGIDLRLSPKSREITFDLHIDGRHQPKRVFLGPDGDHPDRSPFSLRAIK